MYENLEKVIRTIWSFKTKGWVQIELMEGELALSFLTYNRKEYFFLHPIKILPAPYQLLKSIFFNDI